MVKYQIVYQIALVAFGLASSANGFSARQDWLRPQTLDERNRIVGGREVQPHSLPWQAYIGCGATIICSRYVMTAAHCPIPPSVEVGLHNTTDKTEFQTTRTTHRIKNITPHPDYELIPNSVDGTSYAKFDFAIMELETPIEFRPSAKAISIAKATDTIVDENTVFVTSGWGTLYKNGPDSEVLRSVSVPWVPQQKCKEDYQKLGFEISDDMICAGDVKKGKIDSCNGDSGGPLAWLDKKSNEIKLIGAVSWGKGCAEPHKPGVYADMTKVHDWIKSVIGDCNEKTCNEGNCVNWDDLVEEARYSFTHVTAPKL